MTDTPTPVYRGYTQSELNAQYDQATLVPDMAPYISHWLEGRDYARATLTHEADIRYGEHPRQVMDIFPAAENAPVLIHLHGGAWKRQSKDRVNFMAPHFVGKGAAFIALEFGLAPEASLDEIISHARAGLMWIYHNCERFGGDQNRIHLTGHSSGSHLTAMLLADGWRAERELPENVIKGATLISGLFDLVPVKLSARNDYLFLDDDAVKRNSPIAHIPENGPPLVMAWGDGDLDEFRRQSEAFAQAWTDKGNQVQTMMLPGKNHFDMMNTLGDPREPVIGLIHAQMGLT